MRSEHELFKVLNAVYSGKISKAIDCIGIESNQKKYRKKSTNVKHKKKKRK